MIMLFDAGKNWVFFCLEVVINELGLRIKRIFLCILIDIGVYFGCSPNVDLSLME